MREQSGAFFAVMKCRIGIGHGRVIAVTRPTVLSLAQRAIIKKRFTAVASAAAGTRLVTHTNALTATIIQRNLRLVRIVMIASKRYTLQHVYTDA